MSAITSTPRTIEQVVEAFYRMAVDETAGQNKYSIATLSFWPNKAAPPPEKVLVIDRMTEDELSAALSSKDVVIAGSTFSTDEELEYAKKYLPLLTKRRDEEERNNICVILFQLATPDMNTSREQMDNHLARFNSIMSLGIDELVFLPDLKPHLFHQNLKIAQFTWQSNIERITEMLSHEMKRPSAQEIDKLVHHHEQLLWHDIPSALMPTFKRIDKSLVHDSDRIGNYTCTDGQSDISRIGVTDEAGNHATVKVVEKKKVFTADDLEGIFREYRFLSDVLDHPCLPKCVDMLHGPDRVYFVFLGAPMPTLLETLQQAPGQRASSSTSLEGFKKLSQTLQYIHGRSCAHRNISVRSIHLRLEDEAVADFKLFDFEKAVQVRGNQSTLAPCGTFPSMAPEMAHGDPYIPHLADVWSAGIVLLEMGGGLGCLQACLHNDFRGDVKACSILLEAFFLQVDCHKDALIALGALANDEIITFLRRTLQVRPENRTEMIDIFSNM